MTAHGIRRLDLFVTEQCNLACEYCFAASQPHSDLTEDKLLQAVDWLLEAEAERVHLTLWGGEPLLRFDVLRRVVEHAKQGAAARDKSITFSLPTNASLLREDTLRWLSDQNVEIFLSIDGDETGQRTRPLRAGGSSHRLVSAGMRRALSGAAAPPAIRMTVSPDNARRLAANAQYFIEQGARKLLIYATTDQPWTDEQIAAYAQGQLDLAELFVAQLTPGDDYARWPVLTAWRPILRRLLDGPEPRPRRGPLRHCGVGSELSAFGVDGRLWPCHRFLFYGRDRGDDLSLGSLDEGIDPAKAERFSQLQIEDMQGTERCVDCEVFDLCTQSCLAINYAGTGRLTAIPTTACALMRAQIVACRKVHAALRDDPAYARYLGSSVDRTLSHTADKLGALALSEYERQCDAQPHEEKSR